MQVGAGRTFRLLVEGEPKAGAVQLAAGRIQCASSPGSFHLDPKFVPPLLDFGASDYLMAIARGLLEALSAKSGVLAGMRRQKNQRLAEFTTADIANFWLLYTVNSFFPQFRHLFVTKRGHPEELYTTMLAMASTLTTFSTELGALDLPGYDHEDLSSLLCRPEREAVAVALTLIPSNFISLPLKPIRPSIFATPVFEDRFVNNTRMFLAMRADMDEGELIRRAPDLIKVCSASHMEHLIRQALPGVPLTHAPQPPASIPIKVNHQYFSLSQFGDCSVPGCDSPRRGIWQFIFPAIFRMSSAN